MKKIFYGMSGAMKGTTIEAKFKEINVMNSAIKPWKKLKTELYSDLIEDNNLIFSLLHLVRLQEYDMSQDLILERGVTDPIFYYLFNEKTVSSIPVRAIQNSVKKELDILKEIPEKILLIQEDHEFIKDVIFRDEIRKQTFNNDIQKYLDLQQKYINFTMSYNKIDQVIHITNAKDYIINELNLNYLC